MNTKQANHTPGPWEISQLHGMRSGRAANEYTVVGASGCIAVTPALSNADNAANARLIAAAPDLLAALLSVTVALEQLVDIDPGSPAALSVSKARAAIAKGRGES